MPSWTTPASPSSWGGSSSCDQGTSKVMDHPAFGDLPAEPHAQAPGRRAGQFRRGRRVHPVDPRARSVAGATHVLLMDDDAVIEPESVLRAAALLSLAREEFAVGGQMLDMLRPQEVYEAGALVEPAALGVYSPTHRMNVGTRRPWKPSWKWIHAHYNAWWFFAFPLRLIDRVGLPLPLFIRGDDVEFGVRLHKAGIATATVPGLATWHEPFYLKKGGWQSYYDLRNMLILTSLHFPLTRLRVVKQFLKRLLLQLLSHNYFDAAILCEAADDFCRGPGVLEADPRAIHRNLVALQRELAQETVPRSRCLPIVKPAIPFGSRPRRAWHLLGCLLRQSDPAKSARRRSARPGDPRGSCTLVVHGVGRRRRGRGLAFGGTPGLPPFPGDLPADARAGDEVGPPLVSHACPGRRVVAGLVRSSRPAASSGMTISASSGRSRGTRAARSGPSAA